MTKSVRNDGLFTSEQAYHAAQLLLWRLDEKTKSDEFVLLLADMEIVNGKSRDPAVGADWKNLWGDAQRRSCLEAFAILKVFLAFELGSPEEQFVQNLVRGKPPQIENLESDELWREWVSTASDFLITGGE